VSSDNTTRGSQVAGVTTRGSQVAGVTTRGSQVAGVSAAASTLGPPQVGGHISASLLAILIT
jgi:hypothetical protein